jgi:hypothetical protein
MLSGIVASYLFRDMRELANRGTEDIHPLILYRHQHHAITGEGILKAWVPLWSFAICGLYLGLCLPCLYLGLVSRHAKMSYFILYKTSFVLALFLELLWNVKLLIYQAPIVYFLVTMTDELAMIVADSVDCCWSVSLPFFEVIRQTRCEGPSCLDDFYGPHFIPTFLVSLMKVVLLLFSVIVLFYHLTFKWEHVKTI